MTTLQRLNLARRYNKKETCGAMYKKQRITFEIDNKIVNKNILHNMVYIRDKQREAERIRLASLSNS